jgi:hypothetical protein
MGVNAFGFHFLRERKNINQQEKAIAISLMRLGFTNTYVECTVVFGFCMLQNVQTAFTYIIGRGLPEFTSWR